MPQIMQLKVLRTDVGPAFRARAPSSVLMTSVAWLQLRRMRVAENSFRQIRNKRQNGLGTL